MQLAPLVKRGIGLDLSDKMIDRARHATAQCPNLQFHVGSAHELPSELRDIPFSKIFTNYALHHLPTAKKADAIAALSRHLIPGGRLILGDLMVSDDPDKYRNLFDYVGYGPGCDLPSTVVELEEIFANAGLTSTTRLLNPLVGVIIGHKSR